MTFNDIFNKHNEELKQHYSNNLVLMHSLYGSQNYGLDSEKSDVDTIAWIAPNLNDFCMDCLVSKTFKCSDAGEIKVRDFRKGLDLLIKSNPVDLEVLYSKACFVEPQIQDIWDTLVENRERIARLDENRFARSIAGQAHQCLQYVYSARDEKRKRKNLANILRFCGMLKKYSEGEEFSKCLIADSTVKDIKLGKTTLKDEEIEKLASEKVAELSYYRRKVNVMKARDEEAVSLIEEVKKELMVFTMKKILEEEQ